MNPEHLEAIRRRRDEALVEVERLRAERDEALGKQADAERLAEEVKIKWQDDVIKAREARDAADAEVKRLQGLVDALREVVTNGSEEPCGWQISYEVYNMAKLELDRFDADAERRAALEGKP